MRIHRTAANLLWTRVLSSCCKSFVTNWSEFRICLRYETRIYKEPGLAVIGLVPTHLRLLAVRLAHVHEQRAALGKLFTAVLTERAVVRPNALVDDPHVLLQRALQHHLPTLLTRDLALGLEIHVHDLDVALQLGAVVEAALAELTMEADQLLVNHLEVFAQVAAALQHLLTDVALHRLFGVLAQMMPPKI